MRIDLPSAARNPISLAGAAIATAMAVLFLVLLALEAAGQLRNPYLGLLLFVAVPAVFLLGLLLIPLGIWRAPPAGRPGPLARRLAGDRSAAAADSHRGLRRDGADLRQRDHRLAGGLRRGAPHGVGGVLRHHLPHHDGAGIHRVSGRRPRQGRLRVVPRRSGRRGASRSEAGRHAAVVAPVTDRVPTPVPAPVRSMRPARDTCANCHWPEKAHGDRLRQIREYADDEKSSETVTTVQLHVGGGQRRIGQRHPLAHEPRQPHRVHRHRSGAPDDSVGEADRCQRPGDGVRRRRHHPRTARCWRAPRDGLPGLPQPAGAHVRRQSRARRRLRHRARADSARPAVLEARIGGSAAAPVRVRPAAIAGIERSDARGLSRRSVVTGRWRA